jgi:hypothetical protein
MHDVMRVRRRLDEIFDASGPIDWDDPHTARKVADDVFDQVAATPDLLVGLVEEIGLAGGAAEAGESYPRMDKLVLWHSADRAVRLRLHVFFPGYADRTHNHRWSFVSRIVSGGYIHSLYGSETDIMREIEGGREPRVVYAGRVQATSEYFLHHSMVHSLRADDVAVSLVLRGPSVKDEYFTLEDGDGSVDLSERLLWSAGAARESSDERASKEMSEDGLARVVSVLKQLV